MSKCPVCGKDSHLKFLPFCSDRCKLIDLGRWLGEKYVVHTDESPEDSLPNGDDDDAEI